MDYFARFTKGAKEALANAAEFAKELGHNYVGSEHLLYGISEEGGGASELLKRLGAETEVIKGAVEQTSGKGDYVINQNFGYTPRR